MVIEMNTYTITYGITETGVQHKTIIDASSDAEAEERLRRQAEVKGINIYIISTWCSSYMS